MKFTHCQQYNYAGRRVCVWGGGGGGGGGELMINSLPPCKKGIRPRICVQPAVSHSASSLVRYGWLHADTRPYPFFTSRITNSISLTKRTLQIYHLVIDQSKFFLNISLLREISLNYSGGFGCYRHELG